MSTKVWEHVKCFLGNSGDRHPYILAVTSSKPSQLTTITFGQDSGGGPEWPMLSIDEQHEAGLRFVSCWMSLFGIRFPLTYMKKVNALIEICDSMDCGDQECQSASQFPKCKYTGCAVYQIKEALEEIKEHQS